MKNLIDILKSFTKIGAIGFGGGSALIPIVEKEIVEEKKWFTDEDYLKHTVIANITPGALPVKLATVAGYEKAGGLGAVVGAYATALPSIILMLVLLTLFSVAGESITNYIESASVGITIFIISLLTVYILKVLRSGEKEGVKNIYIMICIAATVLTCGNEIRNLLRHFMGEDLGALEFIMFDISTINLMIISFFMILVTGVSESKKMFGIGACISLLYAIVNGKNGFVENPSLISNILLAMMIGLLAYVLLKDKSSNTKHKEKAKFNLGKQFWIAIVLFLVIPIILFVGLLIMTPNDAIGEFSSNVAISTMTSFGGGEAYVSIAEGIFVQTGLVDAGDFYNKIVAVANTLPGPILVKIAAGVGFMLGGTIGGVVYGWLLGLLAMSISIAACCSLSVVVLAGYDALKDSKALIMIKKFILPVVCGMLISTSLSMIVESMHITSHKDISVVVSIAGIISGVLLLNFLHKKEKANDLVMLAGSSAVSMLVLL